jgi:hypothetical protein
MLKGVKNHEEVLDRGCVSHVYAAASVGRMVRGGSGTAAGYVSIFHNFEFHAEFYRASNSTLHLCAIQGEPTFLCARDWA